MNLPSRFKSDPPPSDSSIGVREGSEGEVIFQLPSMGLTRWTLFAIASGIVVIAIFWRHGAAFFELVEPAKQAMISHRGGTKLLGLGILMLVLGVVFCLGNQRLIFTPAECRKQLRVFGLKFAAIHIPWKGVDRFAAELSGKDPVIQIYRTDNEGPVIIEGFESAEERDWCIAQLTRYREAVLSS